MGNMQTEAMNKWVVWKSDTIGEYIKADEVKEENDTVSFIKHTLTVDVEVAKYNLKDIEGYSKVE